MSKSLPYTSKVKAKNTEQEDQNHDLPKIKAFLSSKSFINQFSIHLHSFKTCKIFYVLAQLKVVAVVGLFDFFLEKTSDLRGVCRALYRELVAGVKQRGGCGRARPSPRLSSHHDNATSPASPACLPFFSVSSCPSPLLSFQCGQLIVVACRVCSAPSPFPSPIIFSCLLRILLSPLSLLRDQSLHFSSSVYHMQIDNRPYALGLFSLLFKPPELSLLQSLTNSPPNLS